MNDFFSSFYPLEKLQFGSDDTVLIFYFIFVQILNSAYFGQGEEFLITCMQSLKKVRDDLGSEEVLTKIQRAVLLLKTYLETFRRKYAYHFRRMSIDGQGVLTHAELVDLKAHGPIRIVVQTAGSPAGLTEKVYLYFFKILFDF